MEIIFPTKLGSKCQERPSYPIICVLWGGKAGSQFLCLGGVFVCSSGLTASHRDAYSVSGREAQLLQAFRTGYSCLALHFILSLHSEMQSKSQGLVVSGVCLWLAHRPVVSDCTFPVRGPLYSGFASFEPVPSPRDARRISLLLSLLQRCFRSLTTHTLIRQLSAPFTLQQTSSILSPFGWSSTSDPDGLRWSPHLLPILCTYV